MVTSNGKCSCGKTRVTIHLPHALDQYSPRKCDCDFCVSKNIYYLSHPNGELVIESKVPFERQHQGSNQADFITCSVCKTVIAAALQLENKLIGALNSTLLFDFSMLQKPTVVSPQMLSAKEKVERWKAVWLKIKIYENDHI